MRTTPLSENCQNNLQQRNHVCFGISPFNSYFSEERILKLARWGQIHFRSMHFFMPDVPSAYTLEALGYPPEKAAWKARRQCQYLQNKIQRALASAGFSDAQCSSMLLNWETLSSNEQYVALYLKVQTCFENDSAFQVDCVEASRWVLERRVSNENILTYEMLKSAVRYLLAEIPLFLDSAAIVGKESSVFCYHQRVRFLENLYHRKMPIRPSPQQGFVVIEPISPEPPQSTTTHQGAPL